MHKDNSNSRAYRKENAITLLLRRLYGRVMLMKWKVLGIIMNLTSLC